MKTSKVTKVTAPRLHKIEGYAVDIHWADGKEDTIYMTVEEREMSSLNDKMYSAVYYPLVIQPMRTACAWLVEGNIAPFITGNRIAAMSYLDLGYSLTSLGRPQ